MAMQADIASICPRYAFMFILYCCMKKKIVCL